MKRAQVRTIPNLGNESVREINETLVTVRPELEGRWLRSAPTFSFGGGGEAVSLFDTRGWRCFRQLDSGGPTILDGVGG